MKWQRTSLALLFAACAVGAAAQQARIPTARPGEAAQQARSRYRIELALDFDRLAFSGTERVRFVNRDTRSTSTLYFHLYANLRGGQTDALRNPSPAAGGEDPAVADDPHVAVTQVRSAAGAPLQFSLDEQATLLRVNLREPVAASASAEIEIEFAGTVPEIDPDETSLSAHVIQQLSAALPGTREVRRARDTNFRSRGVMLLGAAFPLLAARDGSDWQREVRATVGDALHAEAADYEVTIAAPADLALYTSGVERAGATSRAFAGEGLRGFVIVAGRGLQSAEKMVAGVRVRSVWAREHEKTGRRALEVAARAAEIFAARFGPLPFSSVTIAEAPLVAGVGSAEFAGLSVIASAFYVNFDAPSIRNLPEVVREQRASVEDSLEFAVARMVAHQWWGAAVGSDPEREPVLDEALAHWSALLYYRETYGAERAAAASEDQLRGVYEIYRTFGGDDLTADRAARDYRNSFQYAAIVAAKGALMFEALRNLLGDERVFIALRRYYEANRLEIAETNDLVGAFIAEAPIEQRRAVSRTFDRWLSQRRGDEDISPPNAQLASALGVSVEQGSKDSGNRFARLGKFFWRQMTRIR